VTTEIHRHDETYKSQIGAFYDEAAARLAAHLDAGRSVAVLSEGDPLLYGSYMHLHVRLAPRYDTKVIAGITAMSGSWSQAGLPLVQGDDILTILPGTLDAPDLVRRLSDSEGAVIMKLGRNLPKVRAALAEAGRLEGAVYVERGTMENGFSTPLMDKADDSAPYFSLILVPGWSARP
jgi:precorrin-2/cobalt-factor-2 C20-methyltransferase